MFLRLSIPLIVLILLQNLRYLSESTDSIVAQFKLDYQVLACARADVYRRNLADASKILAAKYSYIEALDDDTGASGDNDDEESDSPLDCEDASFAVFREANPKLPWIYPNWVYRETERGD